MSLGCTGRALTLALSQRDGAWVGPPHPTLDLGQPAGRALLFALVKLCDVVIENFSVRVLAGFGLEYPALQTVRPDLVMLSLPGFGRDGPWRNHLQVGPILEALSGISHISGYAGGPPMMLLAL